MEAVSEVYYTCKEVRGVSESSSTASTTEQVIWKTSTRSRWGRIFKLLWRVWSGSHGCGLEHDEGEAGQLWRRANGNIIEETAIRSYSFSDWWQNKHFRDEFRSKQLWKCRRFSDYQGSPWFFLGTFPAAFRVKSTSRVVSMSSTTRGQVLFLSPSYHSRMVTILDGTSLKMMQEMSDILCTFRRALFVCTRYWFVFL